MAFHIKCFWLRSPGSTGSQAPAPTRPAPRQGSIYHEDPRQAARYSFMQVAPAQDRLSIIFRAFCLVLPPLSLLSQKAVVPWLLIVAVAACAVVWCAERRLPIPDRTIAMGFAALLLWGAITSFWGFDLTDSLVLILRISVIFAAGLMLFAIAYGLDDRTRKNLGNWLLAGISIALGLMAVELLFGFPIAETYLGASSEEAIVRSRLNRGATAMVMIAWPTVALLWQRGIVWVAAILFVAIATMLGLLESNSAILGAIAGLTMALVTLLHHKAGRAMVVLVTIVALACTIPAALSQAPGGAAEDSSPGARH